MRFPDRRVEKHRHLWYHTMIVGSTGIVLKRILDKVCISGREVWPIIEGGKGVSISTGASAGAFAAAGAVGTFSGVQADVVDDNGDFVPLVYKGKTRSARHEEFVQYCINGAISQARIAYEKSKGMGRIHMNVLWEIGGALRILHGALEGAKGLIHGITCGAGMPYGLAALAAQYQVYYYPIISSARVFKILWQRAYHKQADFLGGVVYEDPWLAGGHNGLSNQEDPLLPQDPFPRVAEIRKAMDAVNLSHVPVIMAGGVWSLKEWERFIDSKEIGKIAFQFGTRTIVTQESNVPDIWKQKLLSLMPGDVALNNFSPTGFYSSAVQNNFLGRLRRRSERQIPFCTEPKDDMQEAIAFGNFARNIYVSAEDKARASAWIAAGYTEMMKTPASTVVFVDPEERDEIRYDQINCKGCLSQCRFSNWKEHNEQHNTGLLPDPRSFCISKTLVNAAHGDNLDDELMFAGHNAYRFAKDPLYSGGNIPSVQQLVDKILVGE